MPDESIPRKRIPAARKARAAGADAEASKEDLKKLTCDLRTVNRSLQERVAQMEGVAEALRRSEAGYRELVQNANSAIIRWKSDGTVTFFNEFAQSFFGYDAREIIGKHVGILVPDIDSAGADLKVLVRDIVAHPGRYVQNVNENVCRDGRHVWMAWTNRPIFDENGHVSEILAVGTDITERKHVEEALRESEEKFRSAFANAAIGFAMTTPDGRFLDANAAYCRLTGYGLEELRATKFQNLIHPDDLAEDVRLVDQMLSGQIPYFAVQNRYIRKSGGAVWIRKSISLVRDAAGIPKWIIALIQDISEQKLAEESLLQSREDFRRAQEVGQIGWWRLNVRKNVLTWSDESYRIFGIPSGTPMNYEGFLATCHPDDREYVDSQWTAGLRGDPYDIEHRVVADGRVKWVRERAYLEFDESGNLLGGFGITQDITERKEAEQKVRQLNEDLERRVAERTAEVRQKADQLRALASQLSRAELRERKRLATILHDHIQQLIVAARMQISWLKRDNNPERMQATAQGADGILHEALEASRSLTVDLIPPALNEAGLTGGLSWLAARIREKNRFTVNLRTDNSAEPSSEETRFLLFECARELLFNAVKHSDVAEAQVVLLRTGDGQIKLVVSDQGKGFDPDIVRKRRSGDTTFGLFSIQERLTHVGGVMEVESAPGKGAKITLWVPAGAGRADLETAGEKQPAAPVNAYAAGMRGKRATCHILIVDDHKIMRDGLRGLLQFESGIEVVGEAADGPQAVERTRELRPDVVIMDVNLGEMTGVEATRRILSENPATKIIGLSMHVDSQIAVAMQEAGAAAYLTKGGPAEDLIAAIRACSAGLESHTD